MSGFVSSSLLLAVSTIIHAGRIIILSFVLGNAEFGAVSTVLLIATIFTEFGALGFTQLIYNQSLFEPGRVSRHSRRVGMFLLTGAVLLLATATLVAAIISAISPFAFVTIFLTIFCAATNMVILSACRSSRSNFTHPIAYFIKSIIVTMDIIILGYWAPPIAQIALWGEVIAMPLLLLYAWYIGVLKFRMRTLRAVPQLFATQFKLGLLAIASSASGMLFFNQERLFGVSALTLEQMGILTKLILPKMVAAQGAFLLGVHFHRYVVGLSNAERLALFARIRRFEWIAIPVLLLAVVLGSPVVVALNAAIYSINIGFLTGVAVIALSLVFFFNPYSIMLQATNRYSLLAYANSGAVVVFVGLTAIRGAEGSAVVLHSAVSACFWLLFVRLFAGYSFGTRNAGTTPR